MTALPQRVVVVTGGSRGLGRSIALAFGHAHDRVAVNYVSQEQEANEVVAEIAAAGGVAVACRADVRERSAADRLFEEIRERWGRVDVLINNAGITRDSVLLRMPERDWDDVLSTNLKGPFLCTRAVSRIMTAQRNGHIINIASIVGLQGREGQANYSAAKAGLIGLTKACAREFGEYNVKVNAVLPGYLTTEMGATVSNEIRGRILKDNALGRLSDPDEVARFVRHLSGMQNVSGQIFNLDSRIV